MVLLGAAAAATAAAAAAGCCPVGEKCAGAVCSDRGPCEAMP